MRKDRANSDASARRPFLGEFWEVWILALLMVTILGVFAQSRQNAVLSNAQRLQSQYDPYDIRPEQNDRAGSPLESGF